MESVTSIQVEENQPSVEWSRLILSGRISIAHAAELHRVAVGLCKKSQNITVDCSAAEYLDTSAVQLLMALGREVERHGRSCDVIGAPAVIHEDLRLAGFVSSKH